MSEIKKGLIINVIKVCLVIIGLITIVGVVLNYVEVRREQMILSLGVPLESETVGIFVNFTEGTIQESYYTNNGDKTVLVIEVLHGWKNTTNAIVRVGDIYNYTENAVGVYCIPIDVAMDNLMGLLEDPRSRMFWEFFNIL